MHQFVRELITEWRRLNLPVRDATLVVAVSGGADSLALLLALDELVRSKKLENRIVAAHFNHRLRGEEAEKDEEFVRNLTRGLKIELAAGHANLPQTGNLEQNARVARYDFLCKTAENLGAGAVLTAHTQNDQAETFLMNLIRGSGPAGLGGMQAVREMISTETPETPETPGTGVTNEARGTVEQRGTHDRTDGDSPLLPFSLSPLLLVRPLLNWARRHDTEGYCRDREVDFRYDSMNEDLNFTRVRIRKLLLPLLEEFNPKIIETLAKTTRLMRYETDEERSEPPALAGGFLNGETAEPCDELSLRDLKMLKKPELYRTLREWLARKRGNLRGLELKHIEAIERLALSRKSGRKVELPNGAAVVKTGGRLVYEDLRVEKSLSGD